MSINPSSFAQTFAVSICTYKNAFIIHGANERRHNGVAMFYEPNQMTISILFLVLFCFV